VLCKESNWTIHISQSVSESKTLKHHILVVQPVNFLTKLFKVILFFG